MTLEKTIRVFSLSEANELLPEIASLTSEVVQELDEIRQKHRTGSGESMESIPEPVLKRIEAALQEWSEKVLALGVSPKGYFTVDFQSLDPELLYCWTYGEEKIAYTHKVWENFTHRRPLKSSAEVRSDHLKWIN